MITKIVGTIIGIILYLIPGILSNELLRKKKQDWLLQGGLSFGYAILIGTATGLFLGYIGLFSRVGFLVALVIISGILYGLFEAKRYKAKRSTKTK